MQLVSEQDFWLNIFSCTVLPHFVSAHEKILSMASYITWPFIRIKFSEHAFYNWGHAAGGAVG
jgi:hypothetical protein